MATRPQQEVLDSIVALVAVDVMNRLMTLEQTPKVFLHDQAVLQNLAVLPGARMLRGVD